MKYLVSTCKCRSNCLCMLMSFQDQAHNMTQGLPKSVLAHGIIPWARTLFGTTWMDKCYHLFSESSGHKLSKITSQQDATQLGATQIDVFR